MLGHVTDPKAAGGLALREFPDPTPSGEDVLVDVRAYAVNRGEINLLQQRADGWQPGQDVAGVVVRAAADGSGPAERTRVVGGADGGGWAQQVAVPSYRVAAIPDSVSFAQAAPLGVAGLTALRALRLGGPLLGRRVLVTGASGGVGSFAVQLAAIAGAHVTGHVRGPHRIDVVRSLGADEVVTEIDGSVGPFDLIVDGVGGQILVDALHRLAPNGTAATYGMAGGEKASITFSDFRAAGGGKLMGFFVYGTDVRTFGEDLGYLARLIAAGRLRPHLGVERDWRETPEAVDLLRQHTSAGKVVLTVGAS
jgi:NADPH:quinone reductase-like Zn-dependent oxidoreductase